MKIFTIVNGEIEPSSEASVLITDLAIQRGYGIFDFFKTVDHQPVFMEDHLDRFYGSAAGMRLPVKYKREELKELLFRLIKMNDMAGSGIRITLTGGYSPDGYTLADPNLIVTQNPLLLEKEINPAGISLITHPHQRQLPEFKTIDYLMAIWLQPQIRQQGADDVLYHSEGIVRECPRANFFLVTPDNELLSTETGVLKGITRKHIFNIWNKTTNTPGRDISTDDLRHCKEAFISSSTKNILPVTRIDGRQLGDGRAGEVSRWLWKELKAQTG